MKQVIVIRKDLGMRKGKMVAQGSHASLATVVHNMDDPRVKEWLSGQFTKICVSVNSEEELLEIYQKALAAGLLAKLIIDAGHTEFNGIPTKTAVGIGPDDEDKINQVTGDLKLL